MSGRGGVNVSLGTIARGRRRFTPPRILLTVGGGPNGNRHPSRRPVKVDARTIPAPAISTATATAATAAEFVPVHGSVSGPHSLVGGVVGGGAEDSVGVVVVGGGAVVGGAVEDVTGGSVVVMSTVVVVGTWVVGGVVVGGDVVAGGSVVVVDGGTSSAQSNVNERDSAWSRCRNTRTSSVTSSALPARTTSRPVTGWCIGQSRDRPWWAD